MFSLFHKKNTERLPFPIQVDMHSHILPGLDDGAIDLKNSLMLIRGLMDLGIRKSIATPHVIADMYRNTPGTIQPALETLKQGIKDAGLDFELHAAAEYMLDDQFMALLDQDERLLTLFDNYILTEFPFSQPPLNPERLSFRIITAGYQPILAHPERYGYYHKEPEMYRRLAELGFHLQVNLLSFTGYYGKDVQKAAEWLHKNDLISFAGTDLHHVRHLEALKDVQWSGRALNNDW